MISGPTNVSALRVGGIPMWGSGGLMTRGKAFFVDAVYGGDGNSGQEIDKAFRTLLHAYNQCQDGRGDVIYLLSDYAGTTGTARLDAAFTWAKTNTHLVGVCAPGIIGQRARIAETSGTGIDTLFTVSGGNCSFWNLQWFHGTAVDEDQITVKVTGSRNYFNNCFIAGIGHATPAARAGSRCLVLDGGSVQAGENTFEHCTVGLNTIQRTAACAELGFLATSARNQFLECMFLSVNTAGGNGSLFVSAPASSLQDYVDFYNCRFINLTKQSGSAVKLNGMNIDTNSGGNVILSGTTAFYGCTDVDAASSSNVHSALGPPTAATSALGIVLTH